MTSIFDQIKADREVGTQGDFSTVSDHEWGLDTDGENAFYVIGPNNRPLAIVAVEQAFGMDHINDADMRRFCRLPQLERIALAAEEMARAIEATNKAVSVWADTFPYDDEEGEAASQAAEATLRQMEEKQLVALAAFREACK